MLSRFFKPKPLSEDDLPGGPHSFYKFTLNQTPVILIGELHNAIPMTLANQYIQIFNEYVTNNRVSLYIESADDKIAEKQPGMIEFIDSMELLKPSPHLEVIHSDKRVRALWEAKFSSVWVLADELISLNIADIKNSPSDSKFVLSQTLSDTLDGIEMKFSDWCCSLAELITLISSEVDLLDKLADNYAQSNKELYDFLGYCIVEINNRLSSLLELEDEYCTIATDNEKHPGTHNLAKICIAVIKHTGDLKVATMLHDVYRAYFVNHYDATLICDIWDKSLQTDDKSTLITIIGTHHSHNLSYLLRELAHEEAFIPSKGKDKRIPPAILNEYLNGDFSHANEPDRYCLVM